MARRRIEQDAGSHGRGRRLRHGQPALGVAGGACTRPPGSGVEVVVTSRPGGGARRRARRAAGPGRHAATACASCATPACRKRCWKPPPASRCSACASACRCCSTTARSRTRRAGPDPRPGGQVPARRPAAARRQPLQGAADGLEPRCARRQPHAAVGRVPDDATSTSCTASTRSRRTRPQRGETDYGERFTCAVARDNIFATQFHPEKSADARSGPLSNFLAWKP